MAPPFVGLRNVRVGKGDRKIVSAGLPRNAALEVV
jgi:hypothetical protein